MWFTAIACCSHETIGQIHLIHIDPIFVAIESTADLFFNQELKRFKKFHIKNIIIIIFFSKLLSKPQNP